MPSPSSHSPLLLLVALSLTAAVQARADPEATVIVLAKLPSKQEADAWVQSRKAAVADANKALVLGRFGPFPLVVTAADKAFPGKAIDGAWVIGGACEGGAEKPAVEVLRKHFKEIQLVSGRYEGALDCPIVRGTMVVMLSNGNGAWAALVRDTTGLKATDGEPGTGGSSALDVATAADAQARKLRKRDWVRTPVAVHLKQPGVYWVFQMVDDVPNYRLVRFVPDTLDSGESDPLGEITLLKDPGGAYFPPAER